MVQSDTNLTCVRKNMSELTKEEADCIYKYSRHDGAMRSMLSNLEGGIIQSPEKIFITMLYSNGEFVGWFLVDKAGEYNKIFPERQSIMIYVQPKFRKKGIGMALVENSIPLIDKDREIMAYPSQRKKTFFRKAAKRYNINISFSDPMFYW